MKDFSNASFSPDLIKAMDQALEGAVATLPEPVSSMRVQTIAESILRCAKEGERDPRTLQTMALVEMQIRSDEREAAFAVRWQRLSTHPLCARSFSFCALIESRARVQSSSVQSRIS